MADQALLLPVIVQVLLTFVIGLLTLRERVSASRRGEVAISYFKHNRGKAPAKMVQLGDNYQNQFELPVLFYLLVVLLLVTGQADELYLWLAWGFVTSRFVHAWVHIHSNHIGRRLTSFVIGALLLLVMWLSFIYQILGET